ncbi:putative beta-glucosidase [Lupinus albus]|uniref:Putative beta-glucosidase n=1 Tax=Lupinus albus TaxID=3870 RepID=A0A6A4NSN2_LUPAL|nr:putative beta-glucosidase [Lupinus albus]
MYLPEIISKASLLFYKTNSTSYYVKSMMSFAGQKTAHNSSLNDWSRVKYLHAYIGSILDAVRSGSNVRGYFVWSLLDGLELVTEYEASFGLYYIDLNDPSLKRQPKLSVEWYSSFLNKNTMNPNFTMDIKKNTDVLSQAPLMHNAT